MRSVFLMLSKKAVINFLFFSIFNRGGLQFFVIYKLVQKRYFEENGLSGIRLKIQEVKYEGSGHYGKSEDWR